MKRISQRPPQSPGASSFSGRNPPVAPTKHQGFVKDNRTGAILNISKDDAAAYKARAEALKAAKANIEQTKTDLAEIKAMLQILLDRTKPPE